MRQTIAAFWILVVISHADDSPESDQDWIREGLSAQLAKYERITFMPHPKQKSIVAAHCEGQISWWGQLQIFHHTGDTIDWIATFPNDYHSNNYLVSFQWKHLKQLDLWVLEVFDSSHMGNGSLWLFTLDGHDLRLLLKTRAVDCHHEGARPNGTSEVFRQGRLNVEYHVPEDKNFETVSLTGTIVVLDGEDREVNSRRYSETWTWDPGKRVFTRPPT